jgi:hypothetical protein
MTMQCSHVAPVSTTPTQTKVLVLGQPVATTANLLTVTGCPFAVGPKPQPCVIVKWLMIAGRIKVLGQPALLQTPPGPGTGAGLGQSVEQIPQGPPIVGAVQTRVLGM